MISRIFQIRCILMCTFLTRGSFNFVLLLLEPKNNIISSLRQPIFKVHVLLLTIRHPQKNFARTLPSFKFELKVNVYISMNDMYYVAFMEFFTFGSSLLTKWQFVLDRIWAAQASTSGISGGSCILQVVNDFGIISARTQKV